MSKRSNLDILAEQIILQNNLQRSATMKINKKQPKILVGVDKRYA